MDRGTQLADSPSRMIFLGKMNDVASFAVLGGRLEKGLPSQPSAIGEKGRHTVLPDFTDFTTGGDAPAGGCHREPVKPSRGPVPAQAQVPAGVKRLWGRGHVEVCDWQRDANTGYHISYSVATEK